MNELYCCCFFFFKIKLADTDFALKNGSKSNSHTQGVGASIECPRIISKFSDICRGKRTAKNIDWLRTMIILQSNIPQIAECQQLLSISNGHFF